jgi:hypothetical protein
LDKSFYGDRQSDRQTDDTAANTIARPLYLFITIVIIKEGRAKKMRDFVGEFINFLEGRIGRNKHLYKIITNERANTKLIIMMVHTYM